MLVKEFGSGVRGLWNIDVTCGLNQQNSWGSVSTTNKFNHCGDNWRMLYHVIAIKAQNQFTNDNRSLRKLYLLLDHFTSVDWYTHIPSPTHKLSHEIIRSIWWRDLSYECQNRQQVSCPHGCWNASTRSFCLSQAAYTSSPQPLFESHCFLWKLRSNPIKPIGQEHYFQ